jgi:aspartate-semialdehyde dehydrogenase
MKPMPREVNVAVVGATGAVGRRFCSILEQRNFPVKSIRFFASERSAGTPMEFRGTTFKVETLTPASFAGIDIVLSSVGGEHSKQWSPVAAAAGCVVVDNSSAWRMHPDVPLVVPEVNPGDVAAHHGIIANPNCATIQLVVALKPLHDRAKIRRITVTTLQSVGGSGQKGLAELERQLRHFTGGSDALEDQVRRAAQGGPPAPRELYPHQIAFNALPFVPSFQPDGYTGEEMKLLNETRKIMHEPAVRVSMTCTRVPVLVGHSEAVNVEFERPITPAEARELLSAAPGVKVVDDPARHEYPLAIHAAGTDPVYVGRIRADYGAEDGKGLAMWIVADNLRKGAALNAVQIAELLVAGDHLKGAAKRKPLSM